MHVGQLAGLCLKAVAPVDSPANASANVPGLSLKYLEGPCLFWRRASTCPASEVLASPALLPSPRYADLQRNAKPAPLPAFPVSLLASWLI